MRPVSFRPLVAAALCAAACAAVSAPAAAQQPAGAARRDSVRRDSAQTFAGWPRALSRTSPPGGDTTGYWQQRANYRVIASLDERREVLSASGRLTYVNHSPDTLRELFVHQHLNAFRPGSRWAATDAREGRVRFQALEEPAFAFERFTRDPVVGGVAVRPEYPGAANGGSDSTVARLPLPRPLGPGDSVAVDLAWEARPSTIPRRQARRGRSYDFAQWYPKVAVYDRGGWQPHALVPAGEFYGEFGDFDVTLVLADDQVVGATGVPVEGDPGWARVSRTGPPRLGAAAYGPVGSAGLEPGPMMKLAAGQRRVRFLARDVHHFGWSTSPDYRYEGGAYVRARALNGGASGGGAPNGGAGGATGTAGLDGGAGEGGANGRVRVWDTVLVHTLWRPGDSTSWGGGRTVAHTVNALGWLERVYGPYGYPQMTVLHRIEQGGTEFPMMQMNGSPSQELVLHEGGHVYSYGLLANNEWQSGWMDEGLTSYQTSWATGDARHQLALHGGRAAVGGPPTDSQLARARRGADAATRGMEQFVRTGRAEPMGRRADLFANFGVYNTTVYARGAQFYSALRDVLGEAAFAAFLRDYYARWALRHVDEPAMRASAERACRAAGGPNTGGACDLGWFFGQWVRGVGYVDYAMRDVRTRPAPGGGFVTTLALARAGAYRHPMPVGVRTEAGWTVVRGDPRRDAQPLAVRTAARPLEVRLDPYGTTEAWSARYYAWPRALRDLTAPSTGRAGRAPGDGAPAGAAGGGGAAGAVAP